MSKAAKKEYMDHSNCIAAYRDCHVAALYQQEHRRNLRHNPDTKRNLYHSAECVGGIRSKPYYSGADTPLSAGHIRTDDFLADAPHGQIFSEHDGSAPLSVVWVLYSPAVYSVIVRVGCQVFGKTAGLSHSFQ